MAEQHCLILHEDKVQLDGFNILNSRITFCFYENGIVISPVELEKRPYNRTVSVENNEIKDAELIEMLKNQRKLAEKTYFLRSDDDYIQFS